MFVALALDLRMSQLLVTVRDFVIAVTGTTLAGLLQVRPPGKKHMHSRSIKRVSDREKERLAARDEKYACCIRSRTSQARGTRSGAEIPPDKFSQTTQYRPA